MSGPVIPYIGTRSLKNNIRLLKEVPNRGYTHVSNEVKQKLIQTIQHQGCKIKKVRDSNKFKVAKDLKLNYATAKTILYSYRQKGLILYDDTTKKRAQFQKLTASSTIFIITKIDGQAISSNQYVQCSKTK